MGEPISGLAAGAVLAGGGGILATLGVAAISALARTRREPPLGDLVIVAPHSDDCMLLGGECALACLAAGFRVTVLYVTDSSPRRDEVRARTRRAEAEAAWAAAGLAKEDLVFLDVPASPVDGPSAWRATDVDTVGRALRSRLAPGRPTVVIVPAAYESHVDHRSVRDAALAALAAERRDGLTVLEVAEYNPVFDVLRHPGRALPYLVSKLPGMNRVLRICSVAPRSFAGPGARLRLAPDPARRRRKNELLRMFTSEWNAHLEELAVGAEEYRVVDVARPRDESRAPAGYVRSRERLLHWSYVALLASVCAALFGCVAMACARLLAMTGPGAGAKWVAVAAALAILVHAVRKRGDVDRSAALASVALGVAWAVP